MSIEVRDITDREEWLQWRQADVTASAAAALLGAHPYLTAYQLAAEKTGRVPPPEQTSAMDRGLELEPVAIRRLHKMQPTWQLEQPAKYYRDFGSRLGATPDVLAVDPAREGFGVVQVKSAAPSAFRRNWRDGDGDLAPPMYAVIQAAVEAELTGADWAMVACLVVDYGIELHLVEVPIIPDLITRVRTEVADFWRTVDAGKMPDIDWKRDSKLIADLYVPSGEMIDLAGDNQLPALCDERISLSADKTAIEARQAEIKAQILSKLAGASGAMLNDGRIVSARQVNRKAHTVKPTTFIDLRVREPKEATP